MVQYVDMNQISQLQGTAPVDSQQKAVYIPAMHTIDRDEFVSSTGSSKNNTVGLIAVIGGLTLGAAALVATHGKGLKAFLKDAASFLKKGSLKKELEAMGVRVEHGADGTALARMANGRVVQIDKTCRAYGIETLDANGKPIASEILAMKLFKFEKNLLADAEHFGITIEKGEDGVPKFADKLAEIEAKRKPIIDQAKALGIETEGKPVSQLKKEIAAKAPAHGTAGASFAGKRSAARAAHREEIEQIDQDIVNAFDGTSRTGRSFRHWFKRIFNLGGELKLEKVQSLIKKLRAKGNGRSLDEDKLLASLEFVEGKLIQRAERIAQFTKFDKEMSNVKPEEIPQAEARLDLYLSQVDPKVRAKLPEYAQQHVPEKSTSKT